MLNDNFPTKHVLDHGLVRRIDFMGNDLSIIRAARVSYDAAWRTGEEEGNDVRLLRRLWTGKPASDQGPLLNTPAHSTPFEAVTVTFEIMAPLFVFRQWHRHRTQSYNELSARYRELPEKFYVPDPAQIGAQSIASKQGRLLSDDLTLTREGQLHLYTEECVNAFATYKQLLEYGWPRELARGVLPCSTYSHMFATANLLNWLRFLSLRCDLHAQYEIRVYADAIAEMLSGVVPETMCLWREAIGS